MKFKQANYEVIPQSIVLDNSDESTQRFLSKFFKVQVELGLDKQDYKCNRCARPIGMVYGRSRLCRYDGLHYCLDCNQDEKAIIPARVIHNWDFNRYTISRENKEKLDLVENEPLINVKLANPLLYQYNASMKECLQLRTQLFYLHAYLFTCQESVALDLRKQVWPSEHLFEHIHLYSLNDLQQVGDSEASVMHVIHVSVKQISIELSESLLTLIFTSPSPTGTERQPVHQPEEIDLSGQEARADLCALQSERLHLRDLQ